MAAGQKAVESTAKEKQVQASALTDHADHASEAETSPTIMKEEVSETTGLAEDSLTMVREGILTATDLAEISPKTEREEVSEEIQQRKASTERISTISGMKRKAESTR